MRTTLLVLTALAIGIAATMLGYQHIPHLLAWLFSRGDQ